MKKLLSLALMLLSVQCLWSQTFSNFDEKLVPPSPEAASLGKFGEFPVSYFSGTTGIEIPFFEISTGRIKVPIKLKYHASGIKVEEMPSRVGLGWALEAGGVITRSMIGYPDEMKWAPYLHIPDNNEIQYGYFRGAPSSTDPGDWIWDKFDAGPDKFFYSFPGGSGKMLFTENGEPRLVNEENIKIEDPFDPASVYSCSCPEYDFDKMPVGDFKITTADGLIYTFAKKENSNSISWNGILSGIGYTYTSSWYLTKIEDPVTDREVTFTYVNLSGEQRLNVNHSQTFGITTNNYFPSSNNTSWTDVDVQVLQRIDFDHGRIEFDMGLTRQDYVGDKAITAVKIFNESGQLQKRFELDYGHAHISGNTNAIDKRLYLKSVQEFGGTTNQSLPKYEFTYNNINSLPARNSKEQDIWGYFNDNGATTLKPKIYVYENSAKEKVIPIQSGSPTHTIFNSTGADRSADETYAQYGMLTEIEYPTGGHTKFSYGLNAFSHNGNTIDGGGIRIEKIESFDGINFVNPVLTKEYTYNIGSIPSLIPQHAYVASSSWATGWTATQYEDNTVVSTSNRANLGSNNGGYVGYTQVTETQKDNSGNTNGYTEHYFRHEADAIQSFQVNHHTGLPYSAIRDVLVDHSHFPFDQYIDKSHRRGLPTKTIVFDKDGNEVTQTDYTYSELSSILTTTPALYEYDYARSSTIATSLGDGVVLYKRVTYDHNVDKLLLTSTKSTTFNASSYGATAPGSGGDPAQSPNPNNLPGQSGLTGEEFIVITDTDYNDAIQVKSKTTTIGSEGANGSTWKKSYKTEYKYPFDFDATDAGGVNGQMITAHYISNPVQVDQRVIQAGVNAFDKLFGRSVTLYKNEGGLLLPSKTYMARMAHPGQIIPAVADPASVSTGYREQVYFEDYDTKGRVLKTNTATGQVMNFAWEADVDNYPRARFLNGGNTGEYGADNFEETSSHLSGGTRIALNAKAGDYYYRVTGSNTTVWTYPPGGSGGKDVYVSFWIRNGSASLSNGASSWVTTYSVGSEWEYRTLKLPANGGSLQLKVSGADIDEFRYTSNPYTEVTTYTYDPYHGLKAICDPSGKVTNFKFDVHRRLESIWDVNGDLINFFEYKYSGQ